MVVLVGHLMSLVRTYANFFLQADFNISLHLDIKLKI
jgi:hypothetical protein